MSVKTTPEIGKTVDVLIGSYRETVIIREINRQRNYIMGQQNPDMITTAPNSGNTFR